MRIEQFHPRPFKCHQNIVNPHQGMAVIIGRQHGNEPTSENICLNILERLKNYKTLGATFIIPLANPMAAVKHTREYQGHDLNRSWAQGRDIGHVRLDVIRHKIMHLVQISDLVIDVHTTPHQLLKEPCVVLNPQAQHLGSFWPVRQLSQSDKKNSMRWYCTSIGKPCIVYEAVEADKKLGIVALGVEEGVQGTINTLLAQHIIDE